MTGPAPIAPTPAPIAVIGLGCRLPGAQSPDELWELLVNGIDASAEVPAARWDLDELYSAEIAPGKVATRRACFVDRPDLFDREFFGLKGVEAEMLDPQQRLLLMATWEALEDAGIPPDEVAGTRTGMWVGYNRLDRKEENYRAELGRLDAFGVALNMGSMLAGRMAFTFDLRGPAVSLDTACSSTHVGIHLACQSLRTGETPLALVGAVNLKLVPHEDVGLAQLGMIAPDGRCKFGDAGADGWVPSDAVGTVVLKRLDRAVADGDRVRAVILGSAVSSDGQSSGAILRPSIDGQLRTLEWAYEVAGVSPADIDFLEAHGTGTPMIDPIELTAFGQFFGPGRPADRPLLVGSVKTNIGHAEAASGIGALTKTVLALEHGQLPATLHVKTPTPSVAWADLRLRLPTTLEDLPDRGRPVLAGITGQGLSCVNAHLVVRQAQPAEALTSARSPAEAGRRHLFAISARTDAALVDLARAYLGWLEPPGPGQKHELRDICYSATARRQHHARRAIVAIDSMDALTDVLRRIAAGEPPASVADEVGTIAAGYLAGERVDWSVTHEPGSRFVPLPTYPWQLAPYRLR